MIMRLSPVEDTTDDTSFCHGPETGWNSCYVVLAAYSQTLKLNLKYLMCNIIIYSGTVSGKKFVIYCIGS